MIVCCNMHQLDCKPLSSSTKAFMKEKSSCLIEEDLFTLQMTAKLLALEKTQICAMQWPNLLHCGSCIICAAEAELSVLQKLNGLEDDTTHVPGSSSEEFEVDDNAVTISNPLRTTPSDAGFSDFDDFGGFQASDSPTRSNADHEAGSQSESVPAAQPSDAEFSQPSPTHWNAFSDPTDAGQT